MSKKNKILILGKGRIGEGVKYYLKKRIPSSRIDFFSRKKGIKNFDILIGALPSEVAQNGLELALKYKKDLLDISSVPISFYLKHKKEILKRGIRVIPGCGVSPGLVNLIAGFESQKFNKITEIEISAGTLPLGVKFSFPFTWCFEDLIEQHLYKASTIKDGRKINLPAFSGYKKENLKEVGEFESYFVEEWSSLFYSLKPQNISFRDIRPLGFFYFFQYLKNYGFFKKENISSVKEILTKKKEDNVTLATIRVEGIKQKKKKEAVWKIFSFAKKKEKLNSMQKATCVLPAILARFLLEKRIKDKGLLFLERVGEDKKLFREILSEIKKEKVLRLKRDKYNSVRRRFF